MIELTGISKYYSRALRKSWVLRHIDLSIQQGEFVSIVGPSGSGKSTLLNIMGLLDEPSGGTYAFDGRPVTELSANERATFKREEIGIVFQAYHLLDDLTVYENIETPLVYQKRPGAERKARVAELLDRFGIVAKKDLFPNQLSGGQQQLVGVARALAGRPRLLLADEPTGNLHSSQGEVVMEAFRELHENDGVTIVQVTHSEPNAAFGTRTVELLDGRVVADTAT
ncbi:ABC transporter ATP-binding protein [Rubrivirga sp.]|uniref:ABC transporter ATP-binding protein n=1 Tax=Rubrivirga sp. TaxID=1885344 RepID=UPI003C77E3C0